jgi:hypothetical protein
MESLGKTLWKYSVPLLFGTFSAHTLMADPSRPSLKSIPIAPSQYQLELAALFAAIAIGSRSSFAHKAGVSQ